MGKDSVLRIPGLVKPDGRPATPTPEELDRQEVEELARAVYAMCVERRIVIEAQVVIQGKGMSSNVIFRKLGPDEQMQPAG